MQWIEILGWKMQEYPFKLLCIFLWIRNHEVMLLRRTRLNRSRRRRQSPYPAAQDTRMAWCQPRLSNAFNPAPPHTHTHIHTALPPSHSPSQWCIIPTLQQIFFPPCCPSCFTCLCFVRQKSSNLIIQGTSLPQCITFSPKLKQPVKNLTNHIRAFTTEIPDTQTDCFTFKFEVLTSI